jgi:hypothetical protein
MRVAGEISSARFNRRTAARRVENDVHLLKETCSDEHIFGLLSNAKLLKEGAGSGDMNGCPLSSGFSWERD